MKKLEEIISILKCIESQAPNWEDVFDSYINSCHHESYNHLEPDIGMIMENLWDALEDYVSNPEWRKEYRGYFGEEKLLELVRQALDELKELGVDV